MRVRLFHVAAIFALLPFPALAGITGFASVIDGNTIEVNNTKVRLYGIDAPEAAQQCRRPDGTFWACGREASSALADLIGRRPVQCEQRSLNRYKRAVATCWVGNNDIGGDIIPPVPSDKNDNGWSSFVG